MKIYITGGNGYVGNNLFHYFNKKKISVYKLTSKPDSNDLKSIRWSMPELLPLSDFTNSILIHSAHDWQSDENFDNTKNLNHITTLKIANDFFKKKGKLFFFISSTAAHINALNSYGKVKFNIENELINRFKNKLIIIKIGFVYGGVPSGLYGKLIKLIKFNVIPVDSKIKVQLTNIDSLSEFIFNKIKKNNSDLKVTFLHSSWSINLSDLLRVFSIYHYKKNLHIYNISNDFIINLILFFNKIPFINLSTERFYGIKSIKLNYSSLSRRLV